MGETRKILVVDDEPNLRELVSGRLEQNGYEVTTAADGYQALTKVKQSQPDLIILDLMLPKIDGYTVCRMLKSSSETSEIPIIMFTARSAPDDERRGREMGADAYITKPFEPPVLLDRIAELLGEKQPEQPAEPSEPAAQPEPGPEPAPAETPPPVEPTAAPTAGPAADKPAPEVQQPAETRTQPEPAPPVEKKESFFKRFFRRLFKSV